MSLSLNAEKRSLWQSRLDAFAQSGMTIAEFCKEQDCSVPSFYQWKRKLQLGGDNRVQQPQEGNRFVQLMPQSAILSSESIVELHVRSGSFVRIRGGSVELLRALVDSLRDEI